MSAEYRRAEACFRLASHRSTGEAEKAAALARGMALIDRHGLDPDDFDIPGRERRSSIKAHVQMEVSNFASVFASVFGECIGCGAVSSVGVTCRACAIKADSMTCPHGLHGYCPECQGLPL